MIDLKFPSPVTSPQAEQLRLEVRDFLSEEMSAIPARKRAESWMGFDPQFSRKLGQKGWLGLTWPKAYGGHERTPAERYVVMEEMLAAGAPVACHWIADRQSGPLVLKYGTEAQKRDLLPRIAAGELYVAIGMSEPDAGSDLAAVRTRAVETDEGWRINGTKLWTTGASHAHFIVLFCRTSGTTEDRQAGTSQLLVDLHLPGISIRPIEDLAGNSHFAEVHFDNVLAPKDALIGVEGQGWSQVMSELAFERSGPERYLSSMALLVELVRHVQLRPDPTRSQAIGRLVSHLIVLRQLSRGVYALLEKGRDAQVHAAIVKDAGARFEQEIPEIARTLCDLEPDLGADDELQATLAFLVMNAPSFSLRGGTREILRGIIARGLGLR